MHFIYLCLIFLLELIVKFTNGTEENRSNNQVSPWSCSLASQRRLECRNLFNFYFSSHTLCRNDNRLLVHQHIDELYIYNDYNCFDHFYQCYFEFDSTWSMCLNSLRKLVIENLSFIVRNDNSKKIIPIDYLKIVNTHGSITELLSFFQFSNRSSIYIQNPYPRWSGMDLYAIYSQYGSIRFKQLWINVLDWYPIVYFNYDQQTAIQQWLRQIPCDCRSYHYDMIFLRDLFDSRKENSNELYCYVSHNAQHSHWTQIPALYYNYKKKRPPSRLLPLTELQENCFDQFTKKRYTINSDNDLQEFYSYFHIYESYSIPLWTIYPYATLPNLPLSSTKATTTTLINNRSSYPSRIDYINIYDYALLFNESRWLSSIEAYPDGRFIIIDNRNQQLLLLNENGTYIIDLTSIFFRQIQLTIHDRFLPSTIHNAYSFSQIHIDQDGYSYLISTLAYFIYIFSPDNRLVRCLTPQLLSISIIRSDCLAITYTGLIYVCDDTYRVIRIYTRMGVPQRTIRLDYLPLKLFIRNNRLFTYSLENTANIQMYTLLGVPIRTLSMCSYSLPSEVIWFRGKYFLTCGTYLFVLDEHGEEIAEHSLHTLPNYSNTSLIIHDFALNKNGLFLVTFRRNGTLFNRYWIIRPTTV
ncbi:unnamed protein product [Rotaria sp. Silwood2]|nr:unnamed protein product [Rotaria sp. Silwood2]CAF3143351.1 unnamed protein product [Rotaria sp. Silwood2]CAF3289623.1 unnamed protein product [Rotaria sp. Silwood2]CAF4131625.1 unnamed protein product [Rotaria sp. Silwood2]CAF4156885.1 unnamed protein product [Rotaria sp. Silwood2]